jgi:large subunit ribosomal protein L18
MSIQTRKDKRQRRRWNIRKKIYGTAETPRMAVMVSNQNIYVQLIDDDAAVTIASVSNAGKKGEKTNVQVASKLGKDIAEAAKGKGISKVVFDRGGYKFHGRVKAIADAANEAGLSF